MIFMFRRKLVYSVYKRVLDSSNYVVKTLLDSNIFVTSRIFKQWIQIIFSHCVCVATFLRVPTDL